ncbi:hypothetical protein EOD42_22335 [Rhodovarius crocodyli]|uniref:Uncharacterized protein n=1 Tax=Rhodovarius crocodyli TaxID=1979269 RepID=A0A437M1C9_9PROT|nr:hypothetical protein [Rhodovarius crocodyli]RVT91396.1 hypothetical protein EOD42_22335 [Rhodovarius crocodyli]
MIRRLETRLCNWLTRRRDERTEERVGGSQKCPWCRQWTHMSPGWGLTEWAEDPSLDVLTCGVCGGTSAWLFGPVMIAMGPLVPPAPEPDFPDELRRKPPIMAPELSDDLRRAVWRAQYEHKRAEKYPNVTDEEIAALVEARIADAGQAAMDRAAYAAQLAFVQRASLPGGEHG